MPATIVAFDGLLCDTLGVRADAIVRAALQDGIQLSRELVIQHTAGRSLYESVAEVVGEADPTGCELITLRAQQLVSQRMSQGVAVTPNAHAWITKQQREGVRLVLRSDSLRRDVERVLRYTELEYSFALVRCADDLPRATGKGSLESSYLAIVARLSGLGISTKRLALECDDFTLEIARRHVDAVAVATAL